MNLAAIVVLVRPWAHLMAPGGDQIVERVIFRYDDKGEIGEDFGASRTKHGWKRQESCDRDERRRG